ncbi:bifunctional nicotinamide-nucleotide adenylyltransferase/Nudix hydroxylase [Aquirhabdus sp.]|uniref:bifunctional nicotinamide-nucleotide adenylyltransferase/Nudix hydroxylase n=1 Tax=Aquirhabdus sp. TaxID=2824160 RepID=UPI00396C8200
MFDYLVFIGRFQPFHLGHLAVIQTALAQSQQVILLIGSAEQPRSTRNTFKFHERETMVLSAFEQADAARIRCVPLVDILYNDVRWVKSVEDAVHSVTGDNQALKIGLVGHYKDRTSYYLSLFPRWETVFVDSYQGISATPIRDAYLLGEMPTEARVPATTIDLLAAFKQTADYQALQEEARYIVDYKESWSHTPYPPTFMTVDAVLVHSGHILLIERGHIPGKGLFALPGGFLDPDETLFNACLRELREETNLGLDDATLRAAYRSQRTFDEPHRCERGRAITQGFYFELDGSTPLPEVLGGDDAKHAFWLPLAEVRSDQLFEDHYAIIDELVLNNL